MAITKIGAPLSGIRGTIGGITFSANGAGTYAKQWAKGANPRTSLQMKQRGFWGRMPSLWSTLSAVQKTAWDTFAALPAQELTNSLGEAYYASGYNWFEKCNVRLTRAGRATISATPTQARPAAPTISVFRVTMGGAESDLCVGGAANASTEEPLFPATYAYDDDLTPAQSWRTLAPNVTGNLFYNFSIAANVKRFRIYPPTDQYTMGPASINFAVWSGGAWQTVSAISLFSWAAATWYEFFMDHAYSGTNHRLNCPVNQGSATNLSICEVEMYKGDTDGSCVIYPTGEFDGAPDYDLVLKVAMRPSIGQQVGYRDFAEVLVTGTPGRISVGIQEQLEGVYGQILGKRAWFAELYRQTREGIRSAAATARTET